MTNELTSQFYIQQFFQYAGWPKYNKFSNVYNACCPICREGKSWGKKKRLYYMVESGKVCCHNCGWYGSVLKWCLEASGKPYDEFIADAGVVDITDKSFSPIIKALADRPALPEDPINIFDKSQITYYRKTGSWSTLKSIISFVVGRRLHRAVNKPKSLYVSLTDKIHKNRLCIPFTDRGKVVHYQTRGVLEDDLKDRPKYLSRVNSEKSLFNIDQVTDDNDTIYITEGPLDAFFIPNGVAVAGIQEKSRSQAFTKKQRDQLAGSCLHNRTWCLDSQYLDRASYNKTKQLAASGLAVFIWPAHEGKQYKDFNDMCISAEIDSIDTKWVDENTYTGQSALLLLSKINLN